MTTIYVNVRFEDNSGMCVASSIQVPLDLDQEWKDDRWIAEQLSGKINEALVGYVIPEIQEHCKCRRSVG